MARRVLKTIRAVIDWNGKDVPKELRKLPPGRYLFEVEEQPAVSVLSDEAEDSILAGMADIEAGRFYTAKQVRRSVRGAILKRIRNAK